MKQLQNGQRWLRQGYGSSVIIEVIDAEGMVGKVIQVFKGGFPYLDYVSEWTFKTVDSRTYLYLEGQDKPNEDL